MVDDYVASINLQMFAISTGVSTNTKLFTDTTVASGSFTSDTSSIGSALLVTFAAMQDYIQTTFKKNTDIARMCLSGASKTAADIISTAQKMLGQCTSGYAKKFTTSEKTTATISLSIKSTSSNFAKSLTDCMGSSQTKASTVTCINTVSFGKHITISSL